jgi:hypothetical protein
VATIQIRDVPESAYETIRRRARAAGQSIQAYMRGQVIELASRPTKAEAVATIDDALARHGGTRATPHEIADDVAADHR